MNCDFTVHESIPSYAYWFKQGFMLFVCVYILAEPYICNSYSYFVLKSVSLWYSNINVMYFFVIYCFYDVGNIPSLYQTNYEGLFMSQVFFIY